ncbi:MAG TPA: hypothetical protein VFT16_05195 [Candidatus Saccharimonadales bacterium]|nr:hypothetical protein [Candidatus Saccharimonadales bacterium]
MNIYGAVLASTFGHGRRPLRSAVTKLTVMGVATAALGLALAAGIPPLAAEASTSTHWFIRSIFVMQVVTVASNMSAAGIIGSKDQLDRLLLTLPLSSRQQSVLLLLPTLVITMYGLLLVLPCLYAVGTRIGAPIPVLFLGVSVGSLSGIGLLHGQLRSPWKILSIPIVMFAEYGLLVSLTKDSSSNPAALLSLCLVVALLCLAALGTASRIRAELTDAARSKQLRFVQHTGCLWAIKKIWRFRTMRVGFGAALALSAIIAFLAKKYHLDADPSLATLGQLLAASYTSDARTAARKQTPFEVAGLKGSFALVTRLLLPALLGALLSTAPLTVLLSSTSPAHAPIILLQITSGACLGFMCGFLLAPERRDVSAQIAAALMCVALAILPQRLTILSGQHPAIFFGALAIIGSVVAIIAERKRNTFIWR